MHFTVYRSIRASLVRVFYCPSVLELRLARSILLAYCKVCTRCTLGFALFRPRDAFEPPTPRHVKPSPASPLAPPHRARLAFRPQVAIGHMSPAINTTRTAHPRRQCHRRVLLRQLSFRRHTTYTSARSSGPCQDHTLARGALTVYRII